MARRKKKNRSIRRPKVEKICRNCRLFDEISSTCAVVVLHEGDRVRLPVLAHEPCFFEGQFFSDKTKAMENFSEDIQEVKFWVEDEKGKKTGGDGIVKMEYPEGFFGDLDINSIFFD